MPIEMPETPWDGMVDTAEGQTYVRIVGQGPPVFIVHGGPGFDHSYLYDRLSFLADRRTLIFYDQPGCGKTPEHPAGASLGVTAKHFCALLNSLNMDESYGLIAHSWGSLVVAAAFAEPDTVKPISPTEGMLINPVPLTREGYETCRQNQLSRIPQEILVQAQGMMQSGKSGTDVMSLLLPFYGKNPEHLAGVTMPFRYDTYIAADGALGDFDFRNQSTVFKNMTLIRGECDFTTSDLIEEICETASTVSTIPSVGHFPFIEDADKFRASALRVFAV